MVRIDRSRIDSMLDEVEHDEVVISTAPSEPVSVDGVGIVISEEILNEQWPKILGSGLMEQEDVVELNTKVDVLFDRDLNVAIIRPSDTGIATFTLKAEYDSGAGIIPVITASLAHNDKVASGTVFNGLDEENIHLMFEPREVVNRISAALGGVRLDDHPEIQRILGEGPQ